jgi:hypothetical protein
MRKLIFALSLNALISTAASAATNLDTTSNTTDSAVKIIFERSYLVAPRVNYQTGFVGVFDAPVTTRWITLRQDGIGCALFTEGVRYLNSHGEHVAMPIGNGSTFELYDGQISAINVLFGHGGTGMADCRITVEAYVNHDDDNNDDDNNNDEWIDWQTVGTFDVMADWGNTPHRVGPFAINDMVKSVRVYIPRACGDLELIGSAFETRGIWDEVSSSAFRIARNDIEKTFTYDFGRVLNLDQAAFRIRGKRRDCTAEVQVVYY